MWPLAAAIVVIVAAAAGITGYFLRHNGSGYTVLPFTGLSSPQGVAVDAAGGVYVVDSYNNRVLKLAAGSSIPRASTFWHAVPRSRIFPSRTARLRRCIAYYAPAARVWCWTCART